MWAFIHAGQTRLQCNFGHSVYDFAHIGNFRAYVCSDILKRYLKYKGFKVKHIMNITDVDDKTIKGANKEGISLKEYTAKYEKAFFEDIEALNIDKADIFPRATEHINEMMNIIKKLIKNRIAYKSEDGSVYYDISKFKGYGKLSHTKLKELEAGKRVKQDQYEKEEMQDFALWKAYDKEDGNVFWGTKIGKGRPGWHIECSAMSTKYLGQPFDIHCGGVDLIFPHHENEIAQSEASAEKKFVNYWLHNEHLLVNGKKMSKSLGNFYTLRDLLNKNYGPKAIRYLLLSVHYRQQLNFTEEGVKAAEHSIERLNEFMVKLKSTKHDKTGNQIKKLVKQAKKQFEDAMDDDLNISIALSHIFEFVKEANTLMMENRIGQKDAKEIISLMLDFDKVLGILEEKKEKLSPEIKKMVEEREKARKEKDYEKADRLREDLKSKGIYLEDTKEGVIVKKVRQ